MTASRATPSWRTWLYRLATILFVLGFVASTVAIWANVRIQDSDSWAETVGPLANDPAVQEFVVDQATLVIERQIAVDDQAGRLQSFTRSQLISLVRMGISDFVASPTFATWWKEANRTAHQIVMRTMNNEQGILLQTHGGDLVLDLRPVVDWVNSQLTLLSSQASYVITLPEDQAVIVLYSSETLKTLTNILEIVDRLTYILPVATVLALVGALVARRDLMSTITRLALGLAAGMVIALVLVNVGRWLLVSRQPESHQDVMNALIRIMLADLMLAFRTIAMLALLRLGLVLLLRSRYVNNPRVRAFLRVNREAFTVSAMGLAILWLVWSSYPPIWLTALALLVIAIGGVQLLRWRRETPVTDAMS